MSQALSYAQTRYGCHRLIVTDGLRYGVYVWEEQVFRLYAYLNLTRLRRDYRVLGCSGAEGALLAMAPEWNPLTLNDTMDPTSASGRKSS